MKLKYWKKTERTAYLSLDDLIRGVLSIRTLRHLFGSETELEISDEAAIDLIQKLKKQAWTQITDYLAKAEHSEHQCRNFLERKSYAPDIIDEVIALCKDKGYLDDSRFASILIRSLLERGKSQRAIIQKLREQRISKDIYEPLLEDLYDPRRGHQLLTEQIDKLLFRHHETEPRKAKEKIFASLYRKGFSLDEISSAWEERERQ